MSAPVGPGVPQLPVDRFGNLYATVSGTGPGQGVVDLDSNVRDRFVIEGWTCWSSQDEALLTNRHRSVHLYFCQTNRDSTELSCMCFCSQTSANSMCTM